MTAVRDKDEDGRLTWHELESYLISTCLGVKPNLKDKMQCLQGRKNVFNELAGEAAALGGDANVITEADLVRRDARAVMSMMDTDASGSAEFSEIEASDQEGIKGTQYRLSSMILGGSMTLSQALVRSSQSRDLKRVA